MRTDQNSIDDQYWASVPSSGIRPAWALGSACLCTQARKLQATVSKAVMLGLVEDLQCELFLKFDKFEWKRSILENCVGDGVFDSQILVVRLDELVVGIEMRVLLRCRARLGAMRAGSVVEQAA